MNRVCKPCEVAWDADIEGQCCWMCGKVGRPGMLTGGYRPGFSLYRVW